MFPALFTHSFRLIISAHPGLMPVSPGKPDECLHLQQFGRLNDDSLAEGVIRRTCKLRVPSRRNESMREEPRINTINSVIINQTPTVVGIVVAFSLEAGLRPSLGQSQDFSL